MLIALQLGVTHWFYLYIVWFFPLVMVALLGRLSASAVGALEMRYSGCRAAPAQHLLDRRRRASAALRP